MNKIDVFHHFQTLGRYLMIHYIKWNPNEKRYVTNYSYSAKLCTVFILIYIHFLLSFSFVTTFNKSPWSKYDIVFLMGSPIFIVCCILMGTYPYCYQTGIIDVLNKIHLIDDLLNKCKSSRAFEKRATVAVKYFAMIITLVYVQGTIWFWLFIKREDLRGFLVMGCLAPIAMYHSFFTVTFKIVLLGKIRRIRQLSHDTIRINVYEDNCFICNDDGISGYICYEHMLQLSVRKK